MLPTTDSVSNAATRQQMVPPGGTSPQWRFCHTWTSKPSQMFASRHSSSVAFRVVCSTQRPIVRLLVLPRALKHLSYAPHRARFALRLGLGFLGWRTPDLRSEYNRPTNEWARNFLRVGRRPTDPTRFRKPWPWRTRKTTAPPPSERTVARYSHRDLKSWV